MEKPGGADYFSPLQRGPVLTRFRPSVTLPSIRCRTAIFAIPDFSSAELTSLFALAERMRAGAYDRKPLTGKSLGMIFMKASTRTRVSFEVGTWQLGGHALFLSPRDVQLGRGEPIADTARVLSRYVDGIMIRTFAHSEVEQLAQHASVPVINGLTDLLHPCQILADLLTVRQHLGTYEGKVVAWVGDGNNMANSWLNAAYRLGFELRLACPEGYDPDAATWRGRRRTPGAHARPRRSRPGRACRQLRRVGITWSGGRTVDPREGLCRLHR
jgi:ornithine carbamoyltransferase